MFVLVSIVMLASSIGLFLAGENYDNDTFYIAGFLLLIGFFCTLGADYHVLLGH